MKKLAVVAAAAVSAVSVFLLSERSVAQSPADDPELAELRVAIDALRKEEIALEKEGDEGGYFRDEAYQEADEVRDRRVKLEAVYAKKLEGVQEHRALTGEATELRRKIGSSEVDARDRAVLKEKLAGVEARIKKFEETNGKYQRAIVELQKLEKEEAELNKELDGDMTPTFEETEQDYFDVLARKKRLEIESGVYLGIEDRIYLRWLLAGRRERERELYDESRGFISRWRHNSRLEKSIAAIDGSIRSLYASRGLNTARNAPTRPTQPAGGAGTSTNVGRVAGAGVRR